ncbi:M20/M25/M40 family metallo-hydrolase [Dankookia sp. P2]|uniref:M20/M25/M40 family metallo-hydrolase n=1 Tax=Dankookia sp. P2 TaxID=3423955 RepID=UPI003D67FE3E
MHVGTFEAGTILNIVPDRARFLFEVRSIPGDDPQAVRDGLVAFMEETVLPPLRAVAPDARITVAERSHLPAFDLAEDAPLALLVQRLTGRNSVARVSYGTEAGFFQDAGIATIVCGPGHIAQAHQPEEWVAESQIASCLDFIDRLAGTLAAR